MKRISQTFLFCVLFGFCNKFALAQNCEVSKLVGNKPAIYITFDHAESKSDTDEKIVWLRLHNNTNCKLEVPMDQRRPNKRVVKAENGSLFRNAWGGINFESTHTVLSGSEEMLVYDLFDRQKNKAYVGNIYGDVIMTATLNSGHDLLFALRPTDIRKNWALFLEMNYEGKNSFKDRVRVFYDFNDLPAEVPRSKNKF